MLDFRCAQKLNFKILQTTMLILIRFKSFKKKHTRPYFLLNNISLKFLLKIFNTTSILFKKREKIETTYVFTHLLITRFIHREEKQ